MSSGTLTLRRFNGDEVFRLAVGEMLAWQVEEGVRLDFEIHAESPAIQTLPDTVERPARPWVQVGVILDRLSPAALVGQTFNVPEARTADDDLASICYYEHEDLDDNVIEILGRQGAYFGVRWRATARDVNFYDGSKPAMRVEIEGVFHFAEVDRWEAGA